ncbi:hypothetical protein L2755_19380 [Shewanella abyssi]|uniref:hypothetical protein n=1 Tax=Shewanella abyssi TaxID=311789 RepID=UPI00200CB82E|nr:hypothetical protein [Shewanella abyssi]MCL1051771.1 hypothetical protein [Shewanella abyssi]
MLGSLAFSIALTSGFIWDDIGAKKALVCELKQLEYCLSQLPLLAREQLPNTQVIQVSLGARAAIVLPLKHAKVAGVLVTDFSKLPHKRSVNWGSGHFSLSLHRQKELTYWHELGHLQAIEALNEMNTEITTPFQHEWLADLYLIWRIAKETNSLSLAWQQYHRRNIDVMANVEFMSHWSVPVMSQVLTRYTAKELASFNSFKAFWSDVRPHIEIPNADSLAEFSSLIQRTFGAGSVQSLPGYMYWRKPALGHYLKPTLIKLMGQADATQWLAEHSMDQDGSSLKPRL